MLTELFVMQAHLFEFLHLWCFYLLHYGLEKENEQDEEAKQTLPLQRTELPCEEELASWEALWVSHVGATVSIMR